MRAHLLALASLAAWLLLAVLPARAGGLSVLPTRVDFAPGRGVQSVLITNTSSQTITVETHVVVWPDGAPGQQANDVVVSPAVVTLPPDQRVRVRVGLLRAQHGNAEQAYRLYFTELPPPAGTHGAGVGVRLRIGLPVFVAPAQAQPKPLRWTARTEGSGWALEARNEGNVHTRVSGVRLAGSREPLALSTPYVLPGAVLSVPLPAGAAPAGKAVRWHEGDDERESVVAAHP